MTGVVYAAISLRRLAELELATATNLPAGAVLFKVDEEGSILARSPHDETIVGEPISPPLGQGAGASGSPPTIRTFEDVGGPWLRVVAPVDGAAGECRALHV